METVRVVRDWHQDEGWGVIDSADTPGGCWVGFANIAIDGYRALTPGQLVTLQWERINQDGMRFRAVRAWAVYTEPHDADESHGTAMGSTLTITFNPNAEDDGPEANRRRTP